MATNLSRDAEVGASRPTVLVVDDDEDLADTCRYWLEDDDYRVRTAYSGEDALEAVDDEVDLVLLDRRMPRKSGDETLDVLREEGYEFPVAMMTAVAPDTDIVDMPFDEYLVKPVDRDDVVDTADELLARSDFSEEVREYFALEATEAALSTREREALRDEDQLVELQSELDESYEANEEAIAQREQQLERLTTVNRVIRRVDRALVDADTREAIDAAVCEAVVGTEPYRASLVVEYTDHSRGVRLREAAGPVAGDADIAGDELAGGVESAVDDGELKLLPDPDVALDGFEDGVVLVTPLSYREKSYGALVVGTASDHTISDHETDVFAQLGARIANGITAVEQRRLLLADTVAELEFRHGDRSDPLVRIATETGGELSLRGIASNDESGLTCFVDLVGGDGEEALALAAELDAIANARLVAGGDESLLELSVTEAAIETLSAVGATVRSFDVQDGDGTVVVEAAPDADLKAIAGAVQSAYDDTDLVSKREVERSVQSTESFRQGLSDRLTDRQQAALETAYSAGYYEWPRDSTAEEVAEAMDIAAPTLHEHLRAAERKLLESFVDETV
ncbi:bacterio-opsin activator domain-containing protein [Haloarchaeobius iranensis]|uniref:DNA-binding response regulator, OmpR family, contains REC and winged-helix (WHTH) domain n=1 Tax=Haloarchaeobius iranensis TaxID=996166 RepID=A0A1G9UZY2_9EURY|nr:bacterio-opsin activator domain-containing protein [Haloarchaeobius iranensis]SDM65419.1 DNA-binding response regulator, OmpR family, contains REC and winged-helix (wHTH) domain [Haloarchaeobius iranensis]